jgi:antitoxin HigA-1
LSITEAANLLGVARITLSRLLNGHANISPEMALRLSKFFKTSIESWMNLQMQYDIWLIKAKKARIKVRPFKQAALKALHA